MLWSPPGVSVKVTVTPPTGAPSASVTWNVSVDCSGKPEPRTPIVEGSAPTKRSAAGAPGVGEAVGDAVPGGLMGAPGLVVGTGFPVMSATSASFGPEHPLTTSRLKTI